MANFESAVDVCLANDKMAEAIILAIAGGPELLMRTQKKFFQKNKSTLNTVSWKSLHFLSMLNNLYLRANSYV